MKNIDTKEFKEFYESNGDVRVRQWLKDGEVIAEDRALLRAVSAGAITEMLKNMQGKN
jgi:hypothetical protein